MARLQRVTPLEFLAGLRRLHAKKELKLDGDWAYLRDEAAFDDFLAPLEAQSWVTYIQPPPDASTPAAVVKYLARYLTGGPISDQRITHIDQRSVTFTARTGTTRGGSDETEDVQLSAEEFVRRWSLHVLPKGFTKSRRFGGWSNHHRQRYVDQCRALFGETVQPAEQTTPTDESVAAVESDAADEFARSCPTCGHALERLERVHRTSWRDVFASNLCPAWYRTKESSG